MYLNVFFSKSLNKKLAFSFIQIPTSFMATRVNIHPADLWLYNDPRIDAFGASYKSEDIVKVPMQKILQTPQKGLPPLEQEFSKSDPLIRALFSDANIDAIQDGIIGQIAKKGYKIGRQSEDDIIILIKDVLGTGYAYKDMKSMQSEILRIDTYVVAKAVANVIPNIGMYIRNLKSFDVNPVNELPLPVPSATHNGKGRETPGFINKYW